MKLCFLFLAISLSVVATELSEAFSTTRLNAHQIKREDFNSLYQLLSNPEVGKTILGGVHSVTQTQEILNLLLARWLKYNYGSFMFHDKNTEEFIGRAGLHPAEVDDKDEIILSYAILPKYWKNGYATEMAKALIKQGFERHGFKSIVGFTQPTNEASQKVLLKAGFKYEKTITSSLGRYEGIELVFYRLTKEKFDLLPAQ